MRVATIFLLFVLFGCKSKQATNAEVENFTPSFVPGPHALVYKTSKDYDKLVPVILSEDKSSIVSFPDPKDLLPGENYPQPTRLKKGYLLDNRGIGPNVAFLKYSYEEYSRMEAAPGPAELYDAILDKNPLKELCDCGNKSTFAQIEEQLNYWITSKKLNSVCKKLK